MESKKGKGAIGVRPLTASQPPGRRLTVGIGPAPRPHRSVGSKARGDVKGHARALMELPGGDVMIGQSSGASRPPHESLGVPWRSRSVRLRRILVGPVRLDLVGATNQAVLTVETNGFVDVRACTTPICCTTTIEFLRKTKDK